MGLPQDPPVPTPGTSSCPAAAPPPQPWGPRGTSPFPVQLEEGYGWSERGWDGRCEDDEDEGGSFSRLPPSWEGVGAAGPHRAPGGSTGSLLVSQAVHAHGDPREPPALSPSRLPEGGQEAVVVTPGGRQVPPAGIRGVQAPGGLQGARFPGIGVNRDGRTLPDPSTHPGPRRMSVLCHRHV